MKSYISIYDNVINLDYCKKLIKKFDETPDKLKKHGGVATQTALSEYRPEMKESIDLCTKFTPGWEEVDAYIFSMLLGIIERYLDEHKEIKGHISYDSDEGYTVRKYEKGKGKFKQHTDCASLKIINRRLTVIWYLNDVEEGGETCFPTVPLRVKPKAGSVLLFPPFWMYAHEGCIPLSDDKYIIRTFLTKTK